MPKILLLHTVPGSDETTISPIWSQVRNGQSSKLYKIFKGGATWLSIGNIGSVSTSTNGINWVQRVSGIPPDEVINSAYHDGFFWVATGASGVTYTSADAAHWIAGGSPFTDTEKITSICFDGENWFATSDSGKLSKSEDGAVWNVPVVLFPGGHAARASAVSADGEMVVVGDFGLAYFLDGEGPPVEIPRVFGFAKLNTVALFGDVWVIGSSDGRIYTSVDRISWQQTEGVISRKQGVRILTGNSSVWFAIGNAENIAMCKDGKTWLHVTGILSPIGSNVAVGLASVKTDLLPPSLLDNSSALSLDYNVLCRQMIYQLAANENYVPSEASLTIVNNQFTTSPKIEGTLFDVEKYPISRGEVFVSFTSSTGEDASTQYSTGYLPRNGRALLPADHTVSKNAYEGFLQGSVTPEYLPNGAMPSDYFIAGYVESDTFYETGLGPDGYDEFVRRRSYETEGEGPYTEFVFGEKIQVDSDWNFEVFFPGQFVGNPAIKLFHQTSPGVFEEVGEPWREAVEDTHLRGVIIELFAVTDAEYFLKRGRLRLSDEKFIADFSDIPYNQAIRLAKAKDVETGETVAYISTLTGIPRSYNFPVGAEGYIQFLNRAYTYDAAVTLLAMMAMGKTDVANRVAVSLAECALPNGAFPFSVDNVSRQGEAYVRNGASAWIVYALAMYCREYQVTEGFVYDAMIAGANFLLASRTGTGLQSGSVTGGYGLYGPPPEYAFDPMYQIPWVSTEHNLDSYFMFNAAAAVTGNPAYIDAATSIVNNLLTTHWNPEGYLYQGVSNSLTIDTNSALDCMTWGAYLFMGTKNEGRAATSMSRAVSLYQRNIGGVQGFTPYIPEDGYESATPTIWPEGTLGAAVAFYKTGDLANWRKFIQQVDLLRTSDGMLPYASVDDPVYEITSNPGVIGVAWDVVARLWPHKVFHTL